MGVKIRVSHGHIFLDIYYQGKRKWENLHLALPKDKQAAKEAMRLAEVVRAKREQQLVAGEFDLLDVTASKQSLIQYAEKLASTQNKKNPLPKSLRYLKEYAGSITLGAITPGWLEGYKEFLLQQTPLGRSTASKYLAAIKFVLHRATRDRLIAKDPCGAVGNIKVPEANTQHLTLAEIEKLAKTPLGGQLGGQIKKAFLFACYTGLRISDLRSLKWEHIERDPLTLRKVQEKTDAVVQIPLSKTAWSFIDDKQLHKADEFVFPLLAIAKTNTNQYLVEWAKRGGIEKQLGWHVARRSFGTLALQHGADLKTVSALLGHTSLQHTDRYLKTDTATIKRAIESLPDINTETCEIMPMKRTAK